MNTRREFLIGFGAGLLLTAAGALPAAGAASPADTVRAYLAARARHDSAGQYALFSAKVRAEIPYAQFDAQLAGEKAPLAHAAQDGVSPVMVPLGVFFMDARAVLGYRFSVVGPDPGDPRTVLVRALPPGAAPGKAFLIKIVTVPEAGGAPRMELLPSYEKSIPRDFAVMREHDRRLASLSNLKQIGLALIMYAQAHDGRLPDADGWVDALQSQWAGGPGGICLMPYSATRRHRRRSHGAMPSTAPSPGYGWAISKIPPRR